VPSIAEVKTLRKGNLIINTPAPEGLGMIYYVDGVAVDYDGDGRLDILGGSWPEEPSRLFRNETKSGNWLQVQVEGKKINRVGIGTQVRVYEAGKAGNPNTLLGFQEITVNGGYSSSHPAIAHFGLGQAASCDLEIRFPTQEKPVQMRAVKANQRLVVREP
jgi:hypothetical protein